MNTRLSQFAIKGALAGIILLPTFLPCQAAPATTPSVKGVNALTVARNHWHAIAAGNAASVMEGYGPEPVLHWNGGAFDGDYNGTSAIQAVWGRFIQARAPLRVQISELSETRGTGNSRIVTAYAIFSNRVWTYDVMYRLVFRQNLIVEETWRLAGPGDGPVVNQPA